MMSLWMLIADIDARGRGWRVVSCTDRSVLADYPGGRVRYFLPSVPWDPGFLW
jgi:hypothetical protein